MINWVGSNKEIVTCIEEMIGSRSRNLGELTLKERGSEEEESERENPKAVDGSHSGRCWFQNLQMKMRSVDFQR